MVAISEANHSKTSKIILNHNALIFKVNIEHAINEMKVKNGEPMIKDRADYDRFRSNGQGKTQEYQAGARYECIYKNFLREIRQYFSNDFERFVENDLKHTNQTMFLKYLQFPYLILIYTRHIFDDDLIHKFCNHTGQSFSDFVKNLAFTLGCFILPKYMIKSFSLDVALLKTPSHDLSRAKLSLKKKINSFFERFNHKIQNATSLEPIKKKDLEPFTDYTVDFFGILKDHDLESKTDRVLQLYKLIFRFSIEKLIHYIKDHSYLLILVQYLKLTNFQRMHSRQVLNKNCLAYYRAVENMINFSQQREFMIQLMESSDIIDKDH